MGKNIVETVKALPGLLSLKPATDQQIAAAEIQLRTSFSDEYITYLKEFGAILADGIELTGIAKSDHRNVVSVTERERSLNPNVPNGMYVIENAYVDGIVIWQDSAGGVFKTGGESVPIKIGDSIVEYLMKRD